MIRFHFIYRFVSKLKCRIIKALIACVNRNISVMERHIWDKFMSYMMTSSVYSSLRPVQRHKAPPLVTFIRHSHVSVGLFSVHKANRSSCHKKSALYRRHLFDRLPIHSWLGMMFGGQVEIRDLNRLSLFMFLSAFENEAIWQLKSIYTFDMIRYHRILFIAFLV